MSTLQDAYEPALSEPAIALLKGMVSRHDDEALWSQTLRLQAALRDYLAVLGLELQIDEAEGFAWLRYREPAPDQPALPRLMTRRQLPYLPSLLLALLRKKLVEADSSGDQQRLILNRDELVELVRVFLPASNNEARLAEQVMAAVARVEDLGFLRPMKGQHQVWEVGRIIKAFVDAQWLADFATRLDSYRQHAGSDPGPGADSTSSSSTVSADEGTQA